MPGPTLFQVKRTSVAGREANTTYLPTVGEMGVNLTDGRMWVANSSAAFEIGANCNVSHITTSLAIGNSSVNVTSNSTQINAYTIQLATAAYVGANVNLTTVKLLIGNTVANLNANSIALNIANATANLTLTPVSFFAGNSVANATANSILIQVTNSTATANLQPTQLVVGTSTVNTTAIAEGANIIITTTQVGVGNSTVNLFANSTILKLANSTSNTSISVPSAADWAGSKFLHANGSWAAPVAAAAPGGSNTHVQYNDSGAMNGTAAFTFDEASNTVAIGNAAFFGNSTVNNTVNSVSIALNLGATANLTSNSLIVQVANSTGTANLTSISLRISNSTISSNLAIGALTIVTSSTNNISVPASNGLAYFSKYKAGRMLPVAIGASGWDTPFQPHLLHNPSGCMLPNPGATTVSVLRLVSANTVAFTARSPTNANTFMSMLRIGQTTGATAGTSCSWRNNAQLYWLGNAAGLGGFYVVSRFGVSIVAAQGRAFVGLVATTSALANSNPSALFTQIGFGFDSTQTTWRVMTANATTSNTIDTTMDCSVGNTHWYEGVLFSAPNSQQVGWQLVNLTNSNVAFGTCNSACLPANNTFLAWQAWCNNGSTAGAEAFDWGGVTIETNL